MRGEAYGATQPMRNVATITTPDPKTIMIQPWDKSVLSEIEKSIRDHSELGLNPVNDGNVVRINLPQPTEERRKDLVKVAHAKAEEAKISVRNARHKVNTQIKTELKDKEISEDQAKGREKALQDSVDTANEKIDSLTKLKEKDILTM